MTTLEKIRAEIADLDDADYDYEGYYKAVTDALKIIDKYAEQEPCDDVVSRQAVLDVIDEEWICNAEYEFRPLVESIKQLPSVIPQELTGMSDAVLEHYKKLAEHYNGGTHESIQDTNDGK